MLLVVWLIMSGYFDFTHITMGVFSSLGVVLLHLRIRKYYAFEEEIHETAGKLKNLTHATLHLGRMIAYIPWIIWQIVIASFQVAGAVLDPKMPINPAIMRFKTKLPNTSAKVILGNSITLTPGTITLDIVGEEFTVHALMDKSYGGIEDDSLPLAVARLYEKKPKQIIYDVEIIRSGAEL